MTSQNIQFVCVVGWGIKDGNKNDKKETYLINCNVCRHL